MNCEGNDLSLLSERSDTDQVEKEKKKGSLFSEIPIPKFTKIKERTIIYYFSSPLTL